MYTKQLIMGVLILGLVLVAGVSFHHGYVGAESMESNSYAAYASDSYGHRPPAHLWNFLARDVAARLVAAGAAKGRVYVEPAGDTPFADVFRDMLITALVENKMTVVASSAASDRSLHFSARAVYHPPNRVERLSSALLTPLAGGILYVIRDAYKYGGRTEAAIASLVSAFLWDQAVEPRVVERFPSEVAVTTSLKQGDRYIARTTDVYFSPGHDTWLYSTPPKPTVIPVEG